MSLSGVRKFAESLESTGNPWHKKVASLAEACCTVLEDLEEEDDPEEWTDRNCSQFLESSVDVILSTIAEFVDFKEVEGYFSSSADLPRLQHLRELDDQGKAEESVGSESSEAEVESQATPVLAEDEELDIFF